MFAIRFSDFDVSLKKVCLIHHDMIYSFTLLHVRIFVLSFERISGELPSARLRAGGPQFLAFFNRLHVPWSSTAADEVLEAS